MEYIVFDQNLTKPDRLVLQSLASDLQTPDAADLHSRTAAKASPNGHSQRGESQDELTIDALTRRNDPKDARFVPTVVNGFDLEGVQVPPILDSWLLQPYIRFARSIVRVETDVVMLTHLLLYFATSVPSAIFLFRNFTWIHGILHFVMQVSYMGPYTLMMHQQIHMGGILKKRFQLIDTVFPYITDPLMGHTWNTYYYHHVKHHHVEGNGPHDLSSTLRYQRDDIFHFLHYVGRFYFFIWLDLPLYFLRKGRRALAFKAAFWELSSYAMIVSLFRLNPRACTFAIVLPLALLRLGLMVGNWGQHAFVDRDDPDSDYRSSITLIDVASNRHSFNDGYHTSHHLNPLRHWREHPVSFLKSKALYASQQALVFHNIDYIFITVRLMMKDYNTLARCLVPIGDQVAMSLDERAALLRKHTQQFSEEEIRIKFKKN
ncbi:hypothetical protein S40293_04938 [Stachybotrys chartarum IBT 40293]|nr:hypothetical protein S40293_04938 [Stachybotrys chartarum IBT 40293]